MSENWYEFISAETPLTQGDLVFDCPLLSWQPENLHVQGGRLEQESLEGGINAISADVIVMTQACDLEQRRVENVLLCPHISLADHRAAWAAEMRSRSQNITEKAWKGHCEDICNGFIFNYTMLNRCQMDQSTIDVRIVYFHEVYTIPRLFLESLLLQREKPRFRLRPPYREHLSQAFARFFMRVGLPVPIEKAWQIQAGHDIAQV